MENSSVYVKFSKESSLLNSQSDKLKQELEKELNLSSHILSSHGWYHGRIPWQVSEAFVQQDGDFLIRDSLSSTGDYVLTCLWSQKVFHFLISKVLLRSHDGYMQVHYILQGETFHSVSELVQSYIRKQRPVTQQSGARVRSPVSRRLPLKHLENMFGLPSVESSPMSSPTREKPRSQEIPVTQVMDIELIRRDVCSEDDVEQQIIVASSSPSPPHTLTGRRRSPAENRKFVIVPSSPTENSLIYLEPSPYLLTTTASRPAESPARQELSQPSDHEYEEEYLVPLIADSGSCFRPSLYRSPLLSAENKPLETQLLKRVKSVLFHTNVQTIAAHMTRADCRVGQILSVSEDFLTGLGVRSGMELLTLPHGRQLREDLLERFHTMSILLAIQLLGCSGSAEERAALLHKLIFLASELKGKLGNLFGFATVMKSLEFPQVIGLKKTWSFLRQKFTKSAVLYEKTLRPSLRMMNDGTETHGAAVTTFPHVLPLLLILERSAVTPEDPAESWENADMGVAALLRHLDAARSAASSGRVFSGNAEAKLQGFQEDPEVQEVFLTEFQMRLLWGSNGVDRSKEERYAKFEEVLTALFKTLIKSLD